MKWWDQMPWSSFSECWALSQLFHSPLSLSSRGFLVPLYFFHKGGVICISEVIDIYPGNLDSSLCFFQPSISHDVLCLRAKVQSTSHYHLGSGAGRYGSRLQAWDNLPDSATFVYSPAFISVFPICFPVVVSIKALKRKKKRIGVQIFGADQKGGLEQRGGLSKALPRQ